MQTVHTPQNSHTLRTDDLYVVYDLFPLDDLDLQGRSIPDLYDLYDLYDLAHVAGWEPHNLHDLGLFSLGLICTIRILRSTSNGRLASR